MLLKSFIVPLFNLNLNEFGRLNGRNYRHHSTFQPLLTKYNFLFIKFNTYLAEINEILGKLMV